MKIKITDNQNKILLEFQKRAYSFDWDDNILFMPTRIHLEKKSWIKWVLATGVTLALIALSMIQSRASFVAVGATTVAYILLHTVLYFKVKKLNNKNIIRN